MASNRIGRINEEIQKELASLIRNLKDPRVQETMISITHVETTPDLRYAKVFASFLQLRYTPELVWELDDSITYGAKMMKLINSLGVESDGISDED